MNRCEMFQQILRGQASAEAIAEFPFYPLTSVGMPVPGPNFVAAAAAMDQVHAPVTVEGTGRGKRVAAVSDALTYLYWRALYDELFQLSIPVRGEPKPAQFVPGHMCGGGVADFAGGPQPCRVMVIGKHPGAEEIITRRNFCGASSEELWAALSELEAPQATLHDWYLTNLVKFPQLDDQSDSLPKGWISDCMPLLQEELRLGRPEYVLCLGSHASKALLGTWAAVTNMTGRVETLRIPVAQAEDGTLQYHEMKVMAALHPAAVFRRPELFEPFKAQLSLFLQLVRGVDIGGVEGNVTHRITYSERTLRQYVDAVRADPSRRIIAVDCEWHGRSPHEPGAYLRTVQVSTQDHEGLCIVLRRQGGTPAFVPSIEHALVQLRRLLLSDPAAGYVPRVGGHFFRRDLPWLMANGVDCRAEYAAPETCAQMRTEGGWDTSLAYHAANETASYTLSDTAARLTTAPRYDQGVAIWKEAYCKHYGLKVKELEGYGACPEWVLLPYAAYDPDVTRRCIMRCLEPDGLLDKDWYGNNSWYPYWLAHSASLAFLEMEINGILLDRERVDKLARQFASAHAALLDAFRRRICWPTFNPESNQQCAAFLFGGRFAVKRKGTEMIAIPPLGAVTLAFVPVKTTGHRSKEWAQIARRGEEHMWMPSTDKEVLGILGHGDTEANKLAMQLRDIKFIGQVLKSVLRPPTQEEGETLVDDEGNCVYGQGLVSYAHSDNRLHTRLSQLKETGRASSAAPALQNISNRREDDYARILGVRGEDGQSQGAYCDVLPAAYYDYPIRTIMRASPGHVLIEADYKGAELAVLAWLSGDENMIDHTSRGNLPESHPDYYDIHSRMAVEAFHLTCEPTKTGLKSIGRKGLRVAAKNVIFGLPYGRQAPAIARQCREEGVVISVEDTQGLIDAYFTKYSRVGGFIQACQQCVEDPQWLMTAFKRIRRFYASSDSSVLGEQQRQAQNFPIQGTVADAVNQALCNLYCYRMQSDVVYRLLLQIHDAILAEVPIAHARAYVNEVLPECMVQRVPIWPRRLNGELIQGRGPYYFGIDVKVQQNWGERIAPALAEQLGLVDLC